MTGPISQKDFDKRVFDYSENRHHGKTIDVLIIYRQGWVSAKTGKRHDMAYDMDEARRAVTRAKYSE